MKVLLINGSPREKGCTYTALKEAALAIEKEGVETEIFHIGKGPVFGCTACYKCAENKNNRCVINSDAANTIIEKAALSDAVIIGTPVYFASAAGALKALLDRVFFAGSRAFMFKPGAAVASARRAGTTAALDVINKYFTFSNMPVVSAGYWNMVFGQSPDEVLKDEEGLQNMRTLGKNTAWLVKAISEAKKAGVEYPKKTEERKRTNFIR